MLNTFAVVFVFLGNCVCLGIAGGFPYQDLPANTGLLSISNGSGTGAVSLKGALEPATQRATGYTFMFEKGNPPVGAELMTSLLAETYKWWRDSADTPIRERIEDRPQPYTNIHHTAEPTSDLGKRLLTPTKVGIAYCSILEMVLKERVWPGDIDVRAFDSPEIYREDRQIGKITILHIPLDSKPLPLSQNDNSYLSNLVSGNKVVLGASRYVSNSTNSLSILANPLSQEKAWSDCLNKIAFEIFKHDSRQSVRISGSQLRPGMTLHFYSDFDADIEGNMTMSNALGAFDVDWNTYAIAAQLVRRWTAASREWLDPRPAQIENRAGTVLGEISVGQRGRRVPQEIDVDQGTATA